MVMICARSSRLGVIARGTMLSLTVVALLVLLPLAVVIGDSRPIASPWAGASGGRVETAPTKPSDELLAGSRLSQLYRHDALDGLVIDARPAVHAERGAVGSVRVVDTETGAAWLYLRSERLNDYFGYATTWLGDINGDGWPDLAIGIPNAADPLRLERRGVVRIVSGLDGSTLRTIEGASGELFGVHLAAINDAQGEVPLLAVQWRRQRADDSVEFGGDLYDVLSGERVDGVVDAHTLASGRTGIAWRHHEDRLHGGIAGDLNGDGVVDLADFQILIDAVGTEIEIGADAAMADDPMLALGLIGDLNRDGVVDGADLQLFAGVLPGVEGMEEDGDGEFNARSSPQLPPGGCPFPNAQGDCWVETLPEGPGDGPGDAEPPSGGGSGGSGGSGTGASGGGIPPGDGGSGSCLCDHFKFKSEDPAGAPDPFYVLPGDAENGWTVDFELGREECNDYPDDDEVEFIISPGSVAKFLIEKPGEDAYFDTKVTLEDSDHATIAGFQPGNAWVNVRIRGLPCMNWSSRLPVRVGGEIRVWVDQMATYQVPATSAAYTPVSYASSEVNSIFANQIAGSSDGLGVRAGTALEFGGSPYWFPGGRAGVPSDVIERTNQVPASRSQIAVRIYNADDKPFEGKSLRLASRHGLYTNGDAVSDPGMRSILATTNEFGYASFNVGADSDTAQTIWRDHIGGDPTSFAESSGIVDRIGIVYGRGAQRFSDLDQSAKDQAFTQPTYLMHNPSLGESGMTVGNSLPGTSTNDVDRFFMAQTFDHLALNHTHVLVLQDNLFQRVLADPYADITELTLEWELDGDLLTQIVEVPDILTLGEHINPDNPYSFLRPAVQEYFGYSLDLPPYIPPDPNAPIGTPSRWYQDLWTITAYEARRVGNFARENWEIPAGFLPGWDLVDLVKEVVFKPFVLGEDPNYLIVGLSAIGLMVDAGYLFPPAGAAGNLVIAVMKKVAKVIPEDLFRSLVQNTNRILDAARDLLNFVARVASETGWAVRQTVEKTASKIRVLLGGASEATPDAMAAAIRVAGKCALGVRSGCRAWSDEAFDGLRRLCQFKDEALASRIANDFGEEVAERAFQHCRWLRLSATEQVSEEAVEGLARVLRVIDNNNPDVKLMLQGSQYRVGQYGVELQNKSLRNLGGMEDVSGMPDMLANLRANANNQSGVRGAVFESTVAYKGLVGMAPDIGQPTLLSRLYDDTGVGIMHKIDFITDQYCIQVKRTSGDVLYPSAVRGYVNGELVTGSDYIANFVEQCIEVGLPPCLVSNANANAGLQDILSQWGVVFIRVSE